MNPKGGIRNFLVFYDSGSFPDVIGNWKIVLNLVESI